MRRFRASRVQTVVSGIDLAILVVILLSVLVSFVRGAAREVIGLLTWIAAIVITILHTARFATLLPLETIDSPAARAAVSAIVLFLGIMFIGSLIGWLVRKITEGVAVGAVDRVLGIGFGLLRGVLIVVLLVLAANLVPAMKQEPWWRQSLLMPGFEYLARIAHGQLPPDIAQHFDFASA